MAERRLILNADDLGLSAGVNRGILEAHAAGAVTSASLLVGAPGFADAVAGLGSAPRLDVGLHLNLTAGAPVADRGKVATLWDPATEAFYPLAGLVRRALAGRIVPGQVVAECEAQLRRLRMAGVAVTHLDGHRHVHVLPGIWEAVLTVARRAGGLPVRVPTEPVLGRPFRPARAIAQLLTGLAWRAAARRDGGRDLRRVDHFRGMALLGASDFQRRLLALLDRLAPGTTEIVVHPGYADADLALWDAYGLPREWERAALCSAEVRARLARGDIVLRHFGQL